MNNTPDTFGKRLKAAMEARGKSAKQLWDHVGVSKQSVYNWLRDTHTPEKDRARQIADFLKVSIAYLYEGEGAEGVRITPDREPKRIPKVTLDKITACDFDRIMSHGLRSEEFTNAQYEVGDKAFAVEVRDQSNSPEFNYGDIVAIDPAEPYQPSDFVLAHVAPSSYVIRRLRQHENGFSLEPENPSWPTLTSTVTTLSIVGPVVEHTRKMRR